MNILRINDKVEIKGGVEVYIEHLLELGAEYEMSNHWIGVYNNKSSLYDLKNPSQVIKEGVKLSIVLDYIKYFCKKNRIDIIHVHSISDPKLLEALFEIKPVVRTMHEPRIACPGHGKFWRKSETICNKPYGIHCIYHAYKEGCCNRHPKSLIAAMKNVAFETSIGKRNYKAIIVMSQYMKDEALKVGYTESQLFLNLHFTPIVIDDKLVNTSDIAVKSILYVGRLSKTKGVHYLIEAAKRLLTLHENIQIDIVGSGEDEDFFRSLIPESLSSHFIFHGWKNKTEVSRLMTTSYLLAFPSIYPEAFGQSGIEAMMRAKPVVGFDVGGVSTWLKDGKTGFIVPVKNVDLFAQKLDLLLNDKNMYKKMALEARKQALEKFVPEVHLEGLINIYQKVMSE